MKNCQPEQTATPMSSRERVARTMRLEHPDRAPRDLWIQPGIPMSRKGELDTMLSNHDDGWLEPFPIS